MRTACVIVAAGSGERFGGRAPKQFHELGGMPILEWSRRTFHASPLVHEVVIVLPPDMVGSPPEWIAELPVTVAGGGATRRESVHAGLGAVSPAAEIVLVHDAVRPFVSEALIERVCRAAATGPSIPVIPVTDTIKVIGAGGHILETPDRRRLARAQTPQGFPARTLRERHRDAAARDLEASDDAALCEAAGIEVGTVEGDPHNIKITTPADLLFAEWLVKEGMRRA
jgi:2-C-methyl-D-erythritol 4-phosphate cytidylyltransferase/2-C-methyl-D-erythritol 2,4-cyclodiphosphate synthase